MKRLLAVVAVLVALSGGLWWWYSAAEAPEPEPTPEAAEAEEIDPAVLRGRVTDSRGQPVAEAVVTAGGNEATTGEDGTFAFTELTGGEHALDIEAEGFVQPGPKPLRRVPVEVPPAAERDGPVDLDLTVRRPATLSGQVVAGGDPVAGAGLTLYYLFAEGYRQGLDPHTIGLEATTDEKGKFTLQDVAPGRLKILAESQEHPSRPSREILVEAGETLDDLRIDLAPEGVLVGRVTDGEEKPLRAKVVVSGNRLSASRTTRSGADGRFRVGQLPEGRYRVTARAEGHRSATLKDIEVNRDEPTEKTLRLKQGKGLFGRVVDQKGKPAGRVFVRFEDADGRGAWRRTNGRGQFQWGNAPQRNWSARAISPRHATSQSVAARPGEAIELTVEPGGYAVGKVVDTNGSPVAGARIGVGAMVIDGPKPYGGRVLGFKKVDEDGTFRFGPLRPGKYELQARKKGYAAASSHSFVVESGETQSGVTIRLGRGGTVSGVVRAKEGSKPLAGATVTAFDMTSPFRPRNTKTDGQGRFTLEGVPSGRHSLRVNKGGYLERVISGVQIPEGGSVTNDVTLHKKKKGEQFGFRGIGAGLRRTEHGVAIRNIIPGGGAEEQGLQPGDHIRAVDRQSVDGMPLSKIVQKIRGRAGEPVQLTMERDGRGKFNVEIERGRVVVKGRN